MIPTFEDPTTEAPLRAVAQDGQPYLAELLRRLFEQLDTVESLVRGLQQ